MYLHFFLLATFVPGFVSAESTKSTQGEFMIAAAHPLAVYAGLEILERSGSAVDAAVTVQTVLNLVEPQSSGIGGGAFMLVFDQSTGKIDTYDGRETAPERATPELFLKPDGSPENFFDVVGGGLSVGTPGTVALLAQAHTEHGKLPWSELFQAAIELAEKGFPVGNRLASMLAGTLGEHLKADSDTYDYFFPEGQALEAGEIRTNIEFARTLAAIAENGAQSFYRGSIADNIVNKVQNAPNRQGLLELSDLHTYTAIKRQPVCHPYRTYRICGMGPPSSGGIAIGQILGMLEHFDLTSLGPGNTLSWHLLVEASKLAFADRNHYVADSDFVRVAIPSLLHRNYLRERAQLIDTNSVMQTPVAPGQPQKELTEIHHPDSSIGRSGTSHFSIIDANGNAVSMTGTIEGPFGSRLMVNGFLLNNELTDFSFVPEREGRLVANRVEPRKRPRSSMSPTMVFNADGSLRLIIGSPGGSRIIGYVVKTLVVVLDWGMSVQDAISLPNIVNRNGPTELEQGTEAQQFVQPRISNLGHQLKISKLVSGLHGIEIADGMLRGGADHRREGVSQSSY